MSTLTREDRAAIASKLRALDEEFGDPHAVELADALEADEGALERERLHRGDVQAAREVTTRERDEAREALRDLLDALAEFEDELATDPIAARGRAVLDGVERTHALVPRRACAEAVGASLDAAMAEPTTAERRTRLAEAFAAWARGESPTWPETRA